MTLVEKKVNCVGVHGYPIYLTPKQLKEAQARYPQYQFCKVFVLTHLLPKGQEAYLVERRKES